MKAIGARRRDIRRLYLRTALLLGVLGAVFGARSGSCWPTCSCASSPIGVLRDRRRASTSTARSLVGEPARRPARAAAGRDARHPPRITPADHRGAAGVGLGRRRPGPARRALRRVVPAAQRTDRAARRRPAQAPSLATALQVALAVGTLLALLSLGTAVGNMTHEFFDDSHWDIWAQTYTSKPFDPGAQSAIQSVPGVQKAQPVLLNGARTAGKTIQIGGLPPHPLYAPPIVDGRWYTAAEARAHARVAVIGRSVADKAGAGIGDTIRVETAGGPRGCASSASPTTSSTRARWRCCR